DHDASPGRRANVARRRPVREIIAPAVGRAQHETFTGDRPRVLLAWPAPSGYNDSMATLVPLPGPNAGRPFRLGDGASLIGRMPNAAIYLDSLAVSRQHARVVAAEGGFFVEDLGSSNGTYVNGQPIAGRVPLTEHDTLQVGPYVLALRP